MVLGPEVEEFMENLVDSQLLNGHLQKWLGEKILVDNGGDPSNNNAVFDMDELRELDDALDGFTFDHILRMPCDLSQQDWSSESRFALEDFMYSAARGIWKRFWSYGTEDMFPFYIASEHALKRFTCRNGCKFGALVAKEGCDGHENDLLWENVLVFYLIYEDENVKESRMYESYPNTGIVSQAVLFAMRVLIARRLAQSRSNAASLMNMDTTYVLFIQPRPGGGGGVVKVKGDVDELETNTTMIYQSASGWVQKHTNLVVVSTVERIWNQFGSVNWQDIGALQLLLATFCCIEQYLGSSKQSIADVATHRRLYLDQMMRERKLIQEDLVIDTMNQHQGYDEIEIQETNPLCYEVIENAKEAHSSGYIENEKGEEANPLSLHSSGCMEGMTAGTVLWFMDHEKRRGYRICEPLPDDRQLNYKATSVDEEEGKVLMNVYVEAHPTQLEPSWEDMNTWYQVQRQARILSLMKQKGLSSKHFPKLIDSGKLLHVYKCSKETLEGRCDHPWCGIHILVTTPTGDSLSTIYRNTGSFSPKEILGCCYDCLTALQSAHQVGIQHANITPDHILRVTEKGQAHHVLIEWGHAILEEKDSPHISLNYSSTDVLQEGRVYPVSDVESLVYVLFSLCGGTTPHFENIESALQWRVRAWARRAIQEVLGEASIVLKAFADYVNNLYGTPYAVDYDLWLNRIDRVLRTL